MGQSNKLAVGQSRRFFFHLRTALGRSHRFDGQQGFAECPLCLLWRPNVCVATNRREWDGPAVLPPRTAQRMTGGLEGRGAHRHVP